MAARAAGGPLVPLRQGEVDITTAAVRQPTLDEVFLTLTGHHADDDQTEDKEVA